MLFSQGVTNFRTKKIILDKDTVKIDAVSIVSGSVSVCSIDNILLSDSAYVIDYIEPSIITNKEFRKKYNEIFIEYRVFNFNFKEITRNKSLDSLKKHNLFSEDGFSYSPVPSKSDLFGFGNLTSAGSISRSISVGNNQDAVVNSKMNLQLSGKLTDNLSIMAAITDNNIPIQPEGTTQQIQEFDKVFIQIYNKNIKLTAGDFDIKNPQVYFMRFNKKGQGGLFDLNYDFKVKDKTYNVSSSLAAAISKGHYAKNTLAAIEGNQGPYKLRGSNNEIYIIVLAGTEKVFIDGKLLQRGQDFDYIIDYNTAEVTFMPRNLITKDKRIIVEFEYSDKNYARSMFYTGNKIKGKKLEMQFNFFSEQDIKSQPQNQELSPAQKLLLSQIGDSLDRAISLKIDSIAYSNEFVMYKKIDSLVNGILYDSVFVYSTNADSAHFRLSFSNVGQGRGNYILLQSAANGRVYKWIAPLNGVRQGAYEPVVLLITPQKHQMFTFDAAYKVNSKTNTNLEMAVSNNDLNTFSALDDKDNQGIALRFDIDNLQKISKDSLNIWKLKTSFSHEWAQKNFKPLERYRDAEFERQWNITDLTPAQENFSNLKLNLYDNKKSYFTYNVGSYLKANLYEGLQNILNASLYKGKNFILLNASLTNTKTSVDRTIYLKQNATIGRNFKWFTLGVRNETEKNQFREIKTDTLSVRSFNYEQYEVFINNADTLKNLFTAFYKFRNDFHPIGNSFNLSSKSEDFGLSANLSKASKQRLTLYAAYRKLNNVSNFLLQQGIKPDNNIVGRIEYLCHIYKDLINLNTFYELGSVLELKNEYIFVEVPPGQGAYIWKDYNGNSVKELNEFEIATFQDQANYIKVFTPTNEYVKAYSNQFNQLININPANIWKEKNGLRKFVSRFSEQMNYQLARKTTENKWAAFNPLNFDIADSNMLTINSLLKNIVSFNSLSPVFGIDYNFNDNRSKELLVNGFDSRVLTLNSVKFRLNLLRKFSFDITADNSKKSFTSQFFSTRNYDLDINELEPVISWQPNTNFRISLISKLAVKENDLSVLKEEADFQELGTEFRYSKLEKGNLMAKINFIKIKFNAATNTPLAYEMLDALQAGNNITWNVLYQKSLKNNMQLSLIYDGRKPGNTKVVHYGSVQLRAYF